MLSPNTVKFGNIPKESLRRPTSSSSSFSDDSNCSRRSSCSYSSKWMLLYNDLMKLSKHNYAKFSKTVVNKLQTIIQSGSSASNSQAEAVLYIFYERSMRELVTKSFPVSASLIDTLSSNCSHDVFEAIQPVIQKHLKGLQRKLRENKHLRGFDIGVICLLLSMYKLDRMAGRTASDVTGVIEQIIEDTLEYTQLIDESLCSDGLVMLFFGLLLYCLHSNYSSDAVINMKKFMRKSLIKDTKISKLGKVLAVDILERLRNKSTQVSLYNNIYKKIIQSGKFILDGVENVITDIPFPEDLNGTIKLIEDEETFEDGVFFSETDSGLEDSDEVLSEEKGAITTEEKKQNLQNSFSSNENETVKTGKPCWTRRISDIQNESKANLKLTETVKVPDRCIGRVVGYEGAILRKLEIQSNATIAVSDFKDSERPVTSSVAAHRLITGALGLTNKITPEQEEKERRKIEDAKVKRQTGAKDEQMIDVVITGNGNEIKKARKLIDDIINCIVTVNIRLEYTVDEILNRYSEKLKTIETLLNIYLEIEEQEDDKVIVSITGDKKGCEDAKKLIFEHFGSFRSQHGHLFNLPVELNSVLKSIQGIEKLVATVKAITGGRIIPLQAGKDHAIFISGYPYQTSLAIAIFNKLNTELLCCLSSLKPGNEFTVHDICDFVNEMYGSQWRSVRRNSSPTLMKKFIIPLEEKMEYKYSYTKTQLLDLSHSEYALILPESLKRSKMEDPVAASIIFDEGIIRDVEEVLASLDSPMLSSYTA